MNGSSTSTLQSVRSFYDDVSELYDSSRVASPYQKLLSHLDGGVVFDGVIPGSAIEIGPGTGRITARLHERGLDVTAIDISEHMLAKLRARFPEVRSRVCELARLDEVDGYGTFDNVVACRVLSHVPDVDRALEKMAAAVRPGGRVVFDLWSAWGYVGLSRALRIKRSKVYTRFDSPQRARRLILDAGLRIIRHRGVGFAPMRPYLLELLGETILRPLAHIQMFVCERPPE